MQGKWILGHVKVDKWLQLKTVIQRVFEGYLGL